MKLKKPEKTDMNLNMTSMLDIVFQLIIFFILVTNFAAADLPPLEPPDPIESKARKIEEKPRIVNIVPVMVKETDPETDVMEDVSTGRASHVVAYDKNFVLPGYTPKLPKGEKTLPISDLITLLTDERIRRAENDEPMMVDLRVDKSLPYDQVAPIMKAITAAQITRVNLVALVAVKGVNR